jgi:hypothetical protein
VIGIVYAIASSTRRSSGEKGKQKLRAYVCIGAGICIGALAVILLQTRLPVLQGIGVIETAQIRSEGRDHRTNFTVRVPCGAVLALKELSQYEIADMLTEVLGHKITYVPLEIVAFKNMLKDLGFTPHFQQHMEYVCQDCLDGVFSGTNDLVRKLSGKEPLGMMDYIVKNEALFRALVAVRG